ncbi:MAG: tRNA (adenosine(37)-N6)-dimethylallyltransferase MiaA [Pseudomonadota bacterium]
MEKKKKIIIVLAGPTASGKTDLAIRIAKILDSDIISADSRLVYRDFNIGTAKPSLQEMNGIKHHMIDIVNPDINFTAAVYKDMAQNIIDNLHNNNKIPVIAGGTGFYIKALIDGLNIPKVEPDEDYRNELKDFVDSHGKDALHNKLKVIDPESAFKLHPNDVFRVIRAMEVFHKTGSPISKLQTKNSSPYNLVYAALSTENRDYLYNRINHRVLTMIETGLTEEVKFLISKYGKTLSLLKTLGYKEVVDFMESKCSYNQMIENIQKNTRHFARRQLIWFRPDKRICWYFIDKSSPEMIVEDILNRLNSYD